MTGRGGRSGLYDDPALRAAYAAMRARAGALNDVVEGPALRSLLPPLAGARVADLGCGAGGLCRWLRDQGAATVVGYDASASMLADAQAAGGPDPGLRYELAAIEEAPLAPGSLDLVVSSLALHYVAELGPVVANVAQALALGGAFAFSVEHPVVTCHERAWHDEPGRKRAHWPVDRYAEAGPRRVRWLGLERVPRHHRTVEGYVGCLIDAGLSVRRLLEPSPSPEQVGRWPHLADQRRRPPFLLVRADKAG